MSKQHHYNVTVEWTGNTGQGTKSYTSYSRNHSIRSESKTIIEASSDPAFRGDPQRYNPEELLLSSVSSCHMLWYLHFCTQHNITVLTYIDQPKGTMLENEDGSGYFTGIILYPQIEIAEEDQVELAKDLHHKANTYCFIANSLNFKVQHDCTIKVRK
ncbi:OsmC family protein [Sphingobacterium spiritivorum]|uniref:OsmC family protein n=1 Tax=Sphingobacterium spiritivorum TaxID=258 RepID=UPI003DA5AAE6